MVFPPSFHKTGVWVTGILPSTHKAFWMASLSAARSPMLSSTRASSTSGSKISQLTGNGGSTIGCSGNSRLTGRDH